MIELPDPPKINFLHRALAPLWVYLKRSRLIFGPGIRFSEAGVCGTFIDVDPTYIPAFQFKAQKVGSNKIKICSGYVTFPEGNEDPLVSKNLEIDETDPFTITANSSIWLKLTYTLAQQSHTWVVDEDYTEHHLTMWRLDECTFDEYELKGELDPPTPGTDDPVTPFTTGTLWYEICKINWNATLGEASVLNQIVRGPIQLPDLTEGKLAATYTPP